MSDGGRQLWGRSSEHHVADRALGFALDVGRVGFADGFLADMTPAMSRALDAMEALEGGAIANRDEERMVGHYWLRAPALAPTPEIRDAVTDAIAAVRAFAADVHAGRLAGRDGPFAHVLHVGIGGSALGPQLVADALGGPDDRLQMHFIDNTDPDGIDRVLRGLDGALGRTLVTVASKSGGTPEPRNALLEVRAAYERAGVDSAPHLVAITSAGSALDTRAEQEGWLRRFPLWDWVGGRTSVLSPVGLVPAALQGVAVDALLDGAGVMDGLTRVRDVRRNPAAMMTLAWLALSGGCGGKDMVVLPYKDRLLLFGRYLQQLVMESLGKERDRGGATVHQGLSVYGNKGSTDQHAFVQQLRDGVDNFFVTFVRVLRDRDGAALEVEPGVTAGDYLHGFLLGTRRALHERGRASITITLDRLDASSLGALIALYDRTVGLYAEMINVNAYHQPGVEAGKKAASHVLDVQRRAVAQLGSSPQTADAIADAIGAPGDAETVHAVLEHLAHNDRGVEMDTGETPAATTFRAG
jgi:glucose-6-phosphate isomerase